jgi:tetratricopeptide (TPR) repeat protein
MALEGQFSVGLVPEQLIAVFERKSVWNRQEFREKHFLCYQPDPTASLTALVEAGMFHDKAVDAHETGDFQTAITLEEQAIAKFPRLAEAHLQLATEYFELQRSAEALKVLDRMREYTHEEVPDFHFFRATNLMNLNRLDEAIAEAQMEAAVVGPDSEVLGLLSTLYQMKFQSVLQNHMTQDVPRIGECWLVCLWRFYQLQPSEEIEKMIAELSKHPSRKRLSDLGIPPWRCAMCEFPTTLGAVPVLEKMLISEGQKVFVCNKCVTRRGIPVDKTYPQQHRAWIDGEKFLQYGNVYVNV